jgi:4'-phosphopantetheinyl transferase
VTDKLNVREAIARPTGPGDLRIWHASLDLDDDLAAGLAETLADDERARAARFMFERDRRRFVAARGILRSILGAMLALDANRVRFAYAERGKPSLAGELGHDISFNLAHSEGHALIAVANGADVGVDLEAIQPRIEPLAIAERFFAPNERAALRALPEAEHLPAFFRCWTRKEAYIKALGSGLSHPLDQFEVPIEDSGSTPLHIIESGARAAEWSLRDLSDMPSYAAAVVVRGELLHVQRFSFPPRARNTA